MSTLARLPSPPPGAGRRRAALACGVLASLSVCGGATAQFGPAIELPPSVPAVMPAPPGGYPPTVAATAVGPYFTPSAWNPTLAPNVRFVILSNFNSDAVLDRETGLVWARQSIARIVGSTFFNTRAGNVFGAEGFCRELTVGNRMGWRLPALAELQSLVDSSVSTASGPRLPAGHPFLLSPGGTNPNDYYFAAEAVFDDPAEGFRRRLADLRSGLSALVKPAAVVNTDVDVLCVRGGGAVVPDSPQ